MNYDKLKYWSTAKLLKLARELDYSIYEVGCYGTSDIRLNSMVYEILNKRGIYGN